MSKNPFNNRIIGYGTKPADQFQSNPANWRKHPQKQRDAVQASLRELGWIAAVVENVRTGHLVDGHERVWQALANNEDVPYLQVDLSEDEEHLALAVFDPITYLAETDAAQLDALLQEVQTGDPALQALLAELAEDAGLHQGASNVGDTAPQIDRSEELRQKWQTTLGQLWVMGKHRLICGDCTDGNVLTRLMGSESCHTLIFDPPWDMEVDRPVGIWASVLAFTDGRRAGDVVRLFGAPTWVFVWDCVTSWYAPNRPLQRHKSCFWYGEIETFVFDGAHYGEPEEPKTVTNPRGTYRYVPDRRGKHLSDVFQKQITNLDEDEFHKHQKPVDWFRLLIGDCTMGNVFDPFMGSGTTMVACQQLGRCCFGCEIDPSMVAVTLERMSDMGLSPVRAN